MNDDRIFNMMGNLFLVWCGVVVVGLIGWCMNLVNVLSMTGSVFETGLTATQFIGIFLPPLGAVLGWVV
jgi:hypothetical protein